MASFVIARRCSVGDFCSPSLSGLLSLGTNSTRSRPHCSNASWAAARWPRCGGSNVPPKTPTVTGDFTPSPSPARRGEWCSGSPSPRRRGGWGVRFSLPFELDVAEADGVAGADAGRFERLENAHPLERALEHLD